MKRKILIVLAVLAVIALASPLWTGYFGPKAVAYVTTWRPWRTHIALLYEHDWPQRATMQAEYHDPWPGQARTPGNQVDFLTLRRYQPWLPWMVTEHGTGP
ncbi:MAG TPA: hypothetical protein VMH50_16155 [Thermoleophilia bacterium]|nr:hypothetical protein [Thermoleophilia bacterium]